MLIILLFFTGLFCGSFFNLIVDRLHKNEKGILAGRSHCDHCNYKLQAIDLIPVFSWVFLKGKCRKCSKKLSFYYPLTEIITALIFALTAFLTGENYFLLLFNLIAVSAFWLITISDLKYMEVPDQVSIPAILLLLILILINQFARFNTLIPSIFDALLGSLILISFFLAQMAIGHYILKKDIVGGGDLRIAVLMGLVLGWKLSILALLLSYFIGTAFVPLIIYLQNKNMQSQIAFGPFLSLATFIVIFFGESILAFWMEIVGL